MSLEFYRILHLGGVMWLFLALGAHVHNALTGGTKTTKTARRFMAIGHGVAVLLILVAGFGMLAKLGHSGSGWAIWLWIKLGIWVIFGGVVVILKRKPQCTRTLWPALIILGVVAAALGILKPT